MREQTDQKRIWTMMEESDWWKNGDRSLPHGEPSSWDAVMPSSDFGSGIDLSYLLGSGSEIGSGSGLETLLGMVMEYLSSQGAGSWTGSGLETLTGSGRWTWLSSGFTDSAASGFPADFDVEAWLNTLLSSAGGLQGDNPDFGSGFGFGLGYGLQLI